MSDLFVTYAYDTRNGIGLASGVLEDVPPVSNTDDVLALVRAIEAHPGLVTGAGRVTLLSFQRFEDPA